MPIETVNIKEIAGWSIEQFGIIGTASLVIIVAIGFGIFKLVKVLLDRETSRQQRADARQERVDEAHAIGQATLIESLTARLEVLEKRNAELEQRDDMRYNQLQASILNLLNLTQLQHQDILSLVEGYRQHDLMVPTLVSLEKYAELEKKPYAHWVFGGRVG